MAITNINTASNSDGTSCTLTLASASGSNRVVIGVASQFRAPTNISTMRLNGVTGTQAVSVSNGTDYKAILFYWLDANLPSASGNYTLDLGNPAPAGVNIAISGISFDGGAQTAPGDSDSTSGTAAAQSLSLTVGSGGIVIVGCAAANNLTTNSGQQDILSSTSSGGFFHASSYDISNGEVGYTATSGIYVIGAVAIEAATSALSITSVTPSSFDDGVSGIVIAGSGFGASQGSSTLTIGGQAQTVTAWSDTSITFTSVRGSNSMGAQSLKLTRG